MTLKTALSNINPTGYTNRCMDETVVITAFEDIEATDATGGYTKWPTYFMTRTGIWERASDEEKREWLDTRSYPLEVPRDSSSKTAWIKSMHVGGGWPEHATRMAEILEEVNRHPPSLP